MQPGSKPATGGRERHHEIDNRGTRLLKQAWFNSAACFNHKAHADLLAQKSTDKIKHLINLMAEIADLSADQYFANIPLI